MQWRKRTILSVENLPDLGWMTGKSYDYTIVYTVIKINLVNVRIIEALVN